MYAGKGIDHQWIVHRAASLEENTHCIVVRQTWTIWSVRRQRIKAIHDRKNSCAYRDVRALQSSWIASAVPILVMAPDDWNYRVRKVNRSENVRTDGHVEFHFLEFRGRELSWFVQDVFGNRQLSRVMKESGRFDCFNQIRVRDAKVACQANRERLDTPNMTVGDLIFRVDRHCERFDGR